MTREMAEFEQALDISWPKSRRIHKTGVGVEEGLKQVNWGPYATWSVVERTLLSPSAVSTMSWTASSNSHDLHRRRPKVSAQ